MSMSSDPFDPHSDQLDELYRELYPTLGRFSRGIVGSQSDAEDAVQDAFASAAIVCASAWWRWFERPQPAVDGNA